MKPECRKVGCSEKSRSSSATKGTLRLQRGLSSARNWYNFKYSAHKCRLTVYLYDWLRRYGSVSGVASQLVLGYGANPDTVRSTRNPMHSEQWQRAVDLGFLQSRNTHGGGTAGTSVSNEGHYRSIMRIYCNMASTDEQWHVPGHFHD